MYPTVAAATSQLMSPRRPRPTWSMVALCSLLVAGGVLFSSPSLPADDAHPAPVASADQSTDGAQPEHAAAEHHEEHAAGHNNPVAPVLAAIVLLLFFAKLSGDVFERIGMPAVLGELCVGVLLGNSAYLMSMAGYEFNLLDFLHRPENGSGNPYDPGAALYILAEIGVVLLLFEVGLESNLMEMSRVGVSSLIVAVLGVIAPIVLGLGVGYWFLPNSPWQTWLFLGATLCATSVGITARVLKDLGRSQQRESKIILGAAVIDDVLGLIVLAIASGIIQQANSGATFEVSSLVGIVGKAVGFLVAAIVIGTIFARPFFRAASVLHGHGLLVASALVVCFSFAYLATLVGLAPIVGAFAAGLILEHTHYAELGKKESTELEHAVRPLTALLVPIFFVQMGIEVKLAAFLTNPSVWGLAAALTIAAILGKQVCALGVLEKGLNRQAVGLGMIPRGEVGLIFAAVGAGLMLKGSPVVDESTYAALIVMVMVTTMVTPPLLKWSMSSQPLPDPDANQKPADSHLVVEAHA